MNPTYFFLFAHFTINLCNLDQEQCVKIFVGKKELALKCHFLSSYLPHRNDAAAAATIRNKGHKR